MMKIRILVLAPLVLASLAIVGGVGWWLASGAAPLSLGVYSGVCQRDAEIEPAVRIAVEKKAVDFLRAGFSGDAQAVFAMMSADAQVATPLPQVVAALPSKAMPPDTKIRIARTYLFRTAGLGAVARVPCGLTNGTDGVVAEVKPGATQAYVDLIVPATNSDLDFTVLVVADHNDWKIQSSHQGLSDLGGKDAESLLELARQERDSGHLFYARILYQAVISVLDRGPNFQLGLSPKVVKEISDLGVVPELEGKPPFTWTIEGKTYAVSDVVPVSGYGRKLGVIFLLPQTVWDGEAEADKNNRAFLEAFMAAHQDHARVFGFLAARALKPDRSGGFGTVYEADVGFH